MPTIRILAEGQSYLASPGTMCGNAFVFCVRSGETVPLTIDYTGFLGSDTAASDEWSGDLPATGATLVDGVAKALFAVPDGACGVYCLEHALTASDGRVERVKVRLGHGYDWKAF